MAARFTPLFIRSVVTDASKEWSRRNNAEVSEDARAALVERALEHSEEIQSQLDSGAADRESILQAAIAQFDTGATVSHKREELLYVEIGGESSEAVFQLTGEDVRIGMQSECKWIPWC
jgi:hypothetical protein